ncbi:DUF7000 family protein [Acetobacterium carbinolicum]
MKSIDREKYLKRLISLKENGFKIVIVYLHEKGNVEVWLLTQNKRFGQCT